MGMNPSQGPSMVGPTWQDYFNNLQTMFGNQSQQVASAGQGGLNNLAGINPGQVSIPGLGSLQSMGGMIPNTGMVPGGQAENQAALGAFGAVNPQGIAANENSAIGNYMGAMPAVSQATTNEFQNQLFSQYTNAALQAQAQYLQQRGAAQNQLMGLGLQMIQQGYSPTQVQALLGGMSAQEGFPGGMGAFGQGLQQAGIQPAQDPATQNAIAAAMNAAFQASGGDHTAANIYALTRQNLLTTAPGLIANPNLNTLLEQMYVNMQGGPGTPYGPTAPGSTSMNPEQLGQYVGRLVGMHGGVVNPNAPGQQ